MSEITRFVSDIDRGLGLLDMIDNIDRPGNAEACGGYTFAGTYSNGFTGEKGKCVPKAGAFAGAGIGRAKAEYSIFQAEAKGPNACAGADANILKGAEAMARAEIASASASAGIVGVKVGLGLDTGAKIGYDEAEVKFLGSGIKIGRSGFGISFFGNEFNLEF